MARPVSKNFGPSRRIPPIEQSIGKKPVPKDSVDRSDDWCFSLKYWNQIDYFGLGDQNVAWFSSLLERLKNLCKMSSDKFKTDRLTQDGFHYHAVIWGQTNIPIRKADLKWVPKDFRENDAEYPFYQFSISGANGRVAGFWDDNIFYVVLIDPFHNLCPLEATNHSIYPTKIQLGKFELLWATIERLRNETPNCSGGHCSTQSELRVIESSNAPFGIIYVDPEYYNKAKELAASGKVSSVREWLELGIINLTIQYLP